MRRQNKLKVLLWSAGGLVALLVAVYVSPQFSTSLPQEALAAPPNGNLLQNSEFDQLIDGVPNHWILDPDLRERGTLHVVGSGPSNPRSVLELSPNQRNSNKQKPFGVAQRIPTAGLTRRRLLVRASLRVNEGATAYVIAFALGKNGKPVGSVALDLADAFPEMREQTGYLDVNDANQIIFACLTNTTAGHAWFSGLFLGLNEPTAAAAAAVAESTVASVEVDASRILKPVARGLFGTNIEWVRNGNGVVNDSGVPRSDIVNKSNALGITLVRYPGGGFADFFHWKDAIGPLSARPVRPYVLDPEKSAAVFGLQELNEFCQGTHSEPLLQTNVVTGTAQEAAEWVAYSNRADQLQRMANGSKDPFKVHYWEIGNEQYIKNESSGGLGLNNDAYLTAEEYAHRFLAFSSAMKKVDPSIETGAVGGKNFAHYRFVHDDEWDQTILQEAGPSIDFIAVHNAYAPLVMNDTRPSFDDVYRALVAFPVQVEENFKTLNQEIERYAPRQADHIKIAVTEWGPLFAFLPSSMWVDETKTMGSALFVASLFQVFLRADRVELANFFKLTENGFMGWIGPNADPKPTYYALQMYSRHFGSRLIASRVKSPGFDSVAVGIVSAMTDVPYIDAVSSLNDDGTKLYIVVVNKHFSEAIATDIEVKGFTPTSAAKTWVLTAPSLDANNGDDLVPESRGRWARQSTAPHNSLFYSGSPGAVSPKESELAQVSTTFRHSFPPGSVTAIEFDKGP